MIGCANLTRPFRHIINTLTLLTTFKLEQCIGSVRQLQPLDEFSMPLFCSAHHDEAASIWVACILHVCVYVFMWNIWLSKWKYDFAYLTQISIYGNCNHGTRHCLSCNYTCWCLQTMCKLPAAEKTTSNENSLEYRWICYSELYRIQFGFHSSSKLLVLQSGVVMIVTAELARFVLRSLNIDRRSYRPIFFVYFQNLI